jgi:hypothetical protein
MPDKEQEIFLSFFFFSPRGGGWGGGKKNIASRLEYISGVCERGGETIGYMMYGMVSTWHRRVL